MSKASAPTPPNPYAVGQAQTGTNLSTAVAQQTLNNANVNTPFGSTTFTSNPSYTDPSTGQVVPQFTETSTLSPTQQGVFNNLGTAATDLSGQVGPAITTPLNTNTVDNSIIQAGPNAINQNATNAIFKGDYALLQPILAQQQKDLQDQLSRQGIGVGNAAYSNAETNLNSNQMNDILASLGQATNAGITSANNMYNLALLGQNQQLGQQNMVATAPLTRLSQVYGGTSGATPTVTG